MQFFRQITNKKILSSVYLPLILLFIFANIICDNYIFHVFDDQPYVLKLSLFMTLLFLQILVAPIQSALSDLYCRKKSLIIALSFSCVSLVLVFIYNLEIISGFLILLLISILKGGAGNIVPLSWAALADRPQQNLRFSFGASTASYALGFLVLIGFNQWLTPIQSNITVILIFLILIPLCIKYFYDSRDKDPHNSKSRFVETLSEEITLLIQDLKTSHKRNALFAFLLWEISLYSILLLYVDFNYEDFSTVAISMMCGYLVGILLLRIFLRVKDDHIIKTGYFLSIASLIPFFLFLPFYDELNFYFLSICYFFHTMGNAFLCPTLFAMLAKETKAHQQGRIYGLFESSDTLGFLFASLAVMIYSYFQLTQIYIISFSFLTAVYSYFPYKKFLRNKTDTFEVF